MSGSRSAGAALPAKTYKYVTACCTISGVLVMYKTCSLVNTQAFTSGNNMASNLQVTLSDLFLL